mmetsp:Transcript_27146/g.77994  ORF Transcript_27146/g.77994 Transcript_27146/m.77994 type:complete len:208 (-) Transcript_27146:231-854(-)
MWRVAGTPGWRRRPCRCCSGTRMGSAFCHARAGRRTGATRASRLAAMARWASLPTLCRMPHTAWTSSRSRASTSRRSQKTARRSAARRCGRVGGTFRRSVAARRATASSPSTPRPCSSMPHGGNPPGRTTPRGRAGASSASLSAPWRPSAQTTAPSWCRRCGGAAPRRWSWPWCRTTRTPTGTAGRLGCCGMRCRRSRRRFPPGGSS